MNNGRRIFFIAGIFYYSRFDKDEKVLAFFLRNYSVFIHINCFE